MLIQYNKKLRFHDYQAGQKVWLKTNVVNSGENKLAPKRTGPWTVIKRMPNGVNFEMQNDKSYKKKIVHHDKLKTVKENTYVINTPTKQPESVVVEHSEDDSSDSSSIHTLSNRSDNDYSPSESDSDTSTPEIERERRYPARHRTQRNLPDTIPWASITK